MFLVVVRGADAVDEVVAYCLRAERASSRLFYFFFLFKNRACAAKQMGSYETKS